MIVQNQTKQEWRNVVVTVNDHFRAGAAPLAPGGRLPRRSISSRRRSVSTSIEEAQSVAKIELAATDADGKPVSLSWDGARSK